MNALVLHSPRGLAKPRTQIAKQGPVDSIVVQPMLTAMVRAAKQASAIAVRAYEAAAPRESTSRWVSSRQIESPEPVESDLPEPQSKPTTFQVRRSSLLDIFD